MFKKFVIAAAVVAFNTPCTWAHADDKSVMRNYADIVFENYSDAHEDAVDLQRAIDKLLIKPTNRNLKKAKNAWLVSRESYGQSEVFRFSNGPIDGIGTEAGLPEGIEGPEGQLNAWPLNEAFIDYVKGNPNAGIINNGAAPITVESLVEQNAVTDEADVTTGYHAIEFLLWGQDMSVDGPGTRPVSDYQGDSESVSRRKTYLKSVTDLLVADLEMLVNAWSPEKLANYRNAFLGQDPNAALGNIMTAMATLSGFELASERIAVALDSGDQEDEHSCFSDNTHRDFVTNVQGICNLYNGEYENVGGMGIADLLAKKSPALAKKLDAANARTLTLARSVSNPVDRILASPEGDPLRKPLENLVDALYTQAELLVEAGTAMGIEVKIAGE